MRLALDTNILVYAEGVNALHFQRAARRLLERVRGESTYVPVQVLGELFYVLVRKTSRSAGVVRSAILEWMDEFPQIETSQGVFASAMELSARHHFKIWDAVIVAAAASANCRLLLSEDLQDGFTWSGCTVVNPFAKKPHPLLAALLES